MSLIEIVGVIVSAQQDSFSNCEHLISLTIATVLAENNVIIHCPQISNMTELSYLGCVVNTY